MLKQFGREIWIADGPAVVTAGFQLAVPEAAGQHEKIDRVMGGK
jgi:hypothetical protein